MDRTKYFPGKVFELLATFRIQITNTCSKYLEKIKFWPATPQDSASPNILYLFALLKFTSCFHKWKRYTNHSGHKTQPFTELHNTESLLSDKQLWPQWICWETNRKICFLTQIWGSSWPFAELKGRFVFLPQVMAICRCWAAKHSFLIIQALVTYCWSLAGQTTCRFEEIIHTSNLYGKCVTACMHSDVI